MSSASPRRPSVSMVNSAIRLRGIVKRFGGITAVDGLDLDVPYGTCVGLLGPNGAGKSTTMKALTAQVILDEGEIEVLGYRLPGDSKQARAVMGVVPQLDEPTVGLDPQVRQELWALIDRLRSEGVSILMSTHYIEEAERLCDEVTIMSHGKAVAVGAPSELIAEHAGPEAIEVYGPPTRLTEVEGIARSRGWRTRRTGTSVSILHANGGAPDLEGELRVTNLEDVFVLLTGEEIN